MPKLIKDGEIVNDNWELVAQASELPVEKIAAGNLLLLPLAMWLENATELSGKPNVGLWLDSDQEPSTIADSCQSLPVIGIHFPTFADGRGYSYARQLRDYFGFEGELRALGDVLPDQLFFYQRCGFNAFVLREDRPAESAIAHLDDFSVVYQATNDKRTAAIHKR